MSSMYIAKQLYALLYNNYQHKLLLIFCVIIEIVVHKYYGFVVRMSLPIKINPQN